MIKNISERQKYLHALNLVGKIGPKRLARLEKYFISLNQAWSAAGWEWRQAGLEPAVINNFLEQRKKIDPEKELSRINPEIILLDQTDLAYPPQLKEIYDPPILLYGRGQVSLLKEKGLAVVGSRAMSEYGQRTCQQLTEEIAELGLVIISGLANGIDQQAHVSTLKVKGKTIAVLGSGINDECIFPATNRRLAQQIISQNGLIISEFPPYFKAKREFFPMRNRIISGLALGVLIIEAAARSGALITAQKALEQNRSVLAVPGSIYNPHSQGTNGLLKQGAKLVQAGQDIIDELNLDLSICRQNQLEQADLTKEEKIIIAQLKGEGLELDKIIKQTRLNPACVFSHLTMLELKGIIKKLGSKFIICHEN